MTRDRQHQSARVNSSHQGSPAAGTQSNRTAAPVRALMANIPVDNSDGPFSHPSSRPSTTRPFPLLDPVSAGMRGSSADSSAMPQSELRGGTGGVGFDDNARLLLDRSRTGRQSEPSHRLHSALKHDEAQKIVPTIADTGLNSSKFYWSARQPALERDINHYRKWTTLEEFGYEINGIDDFQFLVSVSVLIPVTPISFSRLYY